MAKYTNTLFDSATFATLWASDPRGVTAEAKARGKESKLARKVAAAKPATARKAPAVKAPAVKVITPTVKRPTGVGSRGGDLRKRLASEIAASDTGARFSPEARAAYKLALAAAATLSDAEVRAELAEFGLVVA